MVFPSLLIKLEKVTALHFFRYPPVLALSLGFFHSFPFSKGEANISSLWKMVRHAHHPELVEGGRQGGIFKALKYYKYSYFGSVLN